MAKACWTPVRWNEGFSGTDGYFRVYRPDHPSAPIHGMCFRSRVVWWLETGSKPPDGWVIHHKNHDKLDDRFENLQVMTRAEHASHHNPKSHVTVTCVWCGTQVTEIRSWALRRKYCSKSCARKARHMASIEEIVCMTCGKRFQTYRIRGARYCSRKCYHAATLTPKQRSRLRLGSTSQSSPTQDAILAALTGLGPTDLQSIISHVDRPEGSIKVTLGTLVKRGQAIRIGRGIYDINHRGTNG